ncbi:MAG: ABC transporter permease [Anaerolineae bacterium]|nr:ABC transporter permease [Anaerolineae bacterium]
MIENLLISLSPNLPYLSLHLETREYALLRTIIRRLLQGLVTMWLVVTVVFVVMRLSGDPVEILYAGDPRPEAEREKENLRQALGLTDPLPVQYASFLLQVARLDFGQSFVTRRPVMQMIVQTLPYTLRLTVSAFVVAYLIALPMGIIVAVRRNSWLDYSSLVAAMGGVSIPPFWVGLMFILLFALKLDWLPASGVESASAYVLPVIVLAIPRLSFMTRYVRGVMLEVLSTDYLRTARAKGLPEVRVITGHAVRNTLIPIVTLMGLQLGYLVGGSVIIEQVFGIPGLGHLLVQSIFNRDFPVVQAAVLILSLSIVLANLLTDLTYPYLDPRIAHE